MPFVFSKMFKTLLKNYQMLGKRRFIFLFVVPLVICVFLWAVRKEASAVQLQRVELKKEDFRIPFKKPLRVLHISDTHLYNGAAVKRLHKALELALPHSPDIAVLTGDFGITPKNDEQDYLLALSYFQLLSQAMPTFACLGNHDYRINPKQYPPPGPAVLKFLADANITLLQNESKSLIINGQRIVIVGMEDYWKGRPNAQGCLPLIDEPREDVHYLLLDHNPDHLLKLQDYDWDVAFSGHAHGGQIKIPFIEWRPHTNLENNHLARPGIHEIFPKRYLCESVGLGNLYELRIFCKPDITILDIK
ncbi:MAG: metallophosphoesterase [Victivallales bacterium]|nr:metallophosphoesterase [Victivallales bacterium]